jgi:hypothetical protein
MNERKTLLLLLGLSSPAAGSARRSATHRRSIAWATGTSHGAVNRFGRASKNG